MTPSFRRVALVALLSVWVPRGALAQSDSDRATARELGQTGQASLDSRDWKRAEDDFRRADALFHAPTLTLGLARAQAAQGRVVEAWESYHRILLENNTTSPVFAKALADAQAEIGRVENRRARVTITAPGADAPRVTVDDIPVRVEALGVVRMIDPGPHVFKATADGYRIETQSLTIPEGATQAVVLTLQKDPNARVGAVVVVPSGEPAPPPKGTLVDAESTQKGKLQPMKTAAVISFVVGGVGLLEGIITGILAVGEHSTLTSKCMNGMCPSTESSDLSTYHLEATLSTIGFIVAGVGAAAGTTLLILAPRFNPQESSSGLRVVPYLGPGSLGATGTF